MRIVKRNQETQLFDKEKIYRRILNLSEDLTINLEALLNKVVPLIQNGMTTTQIDEILAFKAADNIIKHPDYSLLGGRVLMSRQAKLINAKMEEIDYTYDFFSTGVFLFRYSMKQKNGKKSIPVELPSMMYKRVAGNLYDIGSDEYYELLTELYAKRVNFATPIYTNLGVPRRGGCISCELMHMEDDSLEGIESTLTNICRSSKEGAGLGLLIDPIRSKHTEVGAFGGNAAGIVRLADMVQSKMRFYKQGSRAGSCALYLSAWHRDVIDFLHLTLQIGEESLRTRDLFTSLIIPDLFMEKLSNGESWYLFCPHEIKKAGLRPFYELDKDDFEIEYNKAVSMGLGYEIEPKKVWDAMIKSQANSGKPYVFYKDHANKRNMQDNIGIIRQSNLCIEIMEASKPKYTPQCTLGSINFANINNLEGLASAVRILTKALNRVLDINKWASTWSKEAGLDQRALAIGMAGLADFFAKRKIPFESKDAKRWCSDICETMYKNALTQSMELAIEQGRTYPAWEGSRYSKGETYIEGWSPIDGKPIPVLNSLFIGLMPTASSATLLGSFECFEPPTSNLFTRRVYDGEYVVINKYLVNDLIKLDMWDEEMRNTLITSEGSVQDIDRVPQDIKNVYKTVWEIPQKALINLAAIRSKFIDQSQSMNLYHAEVDYKKLSKALIYSWKKGLKTGVYYTRTKDVRKNNHQIAVSTITKDKSKKSPKVEKPKDSPFECFGGDCTACSA